MDAQLRALLDELYASGQANDAREGERAKKMLNLEPGTAKIVSLLIRLGKRRSILEIGTSNGFSTIWLADATRPFGGHVTSIDANPAKHVLADENLRRAGLLGTVELRAGDATSLVQSLSGPFDCVFFDADRRSAPAQLSALLPTLAEDALVMHDNALSHPDEIAEYLALIDQLPDFEHVILPVGKGLSVAYRSQATSS